MVHTELVAKQHNKKIKKNDENNGQIKLVTNDLSLIDSIPYSSSVKTLSVATTTETAELLATSPKILYGTNEEYVLDAAGTSYDVDGAEVTSGGEEVDELNVIITPNVISENEVGAYSAAVVLPSGTKDCTVTSDEDRLDMSLYYGSLYESFTADTGGSVTFKDSGTLSAETNNATSYAMSL